MDVVLAETVVKIEETPHTLPASFLLTTGVFYPALPNQLEGDTFPE